MPVLLDRGTSNPRLFTISDQRRDLQQLKFEVTLNNCVEVGLINNMPDLALEQTERQILKLLDNAAGDLLVRLKLFSMGDLPRGELGIRHLKRLHYRDVAELSLSKIDALIITGAEPLAPQLRREPYWDALIRVLDWANDNTFSTICSCLAVHAAVLHFDGIDRRPLRKKCFGVFNFERVSNNQLAADIMPQFRMPHSRWNLIREDDLRSTGYEVISKGEEGVDLFVKSKKSFFVFFHGHPEYEAWTLLGEYRRDVARFLAGKQAGYPDMPRGYFDSDVTRTFGAFRKLALERRQTDVMSHFPSAQVARKLKNIWHDAAVTLYRNWLKHVVMRKHAMALSPQTRTN